MDWRRYFYPIYIYKNDLEYFNWKFQIQVQSVENKKLNLTTLIENSKFKFKVLRIALEIQDWGATFSMMRGET
jgi:hypothetical protein